MNTSSLRKRLRLLASGMSLLIGSGAVPNALATPLMLIFDDALHTPISARDTPTPDGVATPAWATPARSNVAFTGTHAVVDALLKTQVSTSAPWTPGTFRVLTPLPGK